MWIIIGIIVSLVIFFFNFDSYSQFTLDQNTCLSPAESIDITLSKSAEYEQVAVVRIDSSRETLSGNFTVPNVTTSIHSLEQHPCALYVMRQFGFDYKKMKPVDGFERAIWRYDFVSKKGEKVISLANKASNAEAEVAYGYDFRVSPNEENLILREGYLGSEKYNIVIKTLKNFKTNDLKDVLIIPYKDLTGSNPKIYGSIGFNEWSSDSRYFWGNIFEGAEVTGFFRVDLRNLTHEAFVAPNGTLGGDALVLNPNNDYVPFDPHAYWSPDEEDMNIRKAVNKEKGIHNELHLYHLPTGKDILVDSTSEPLWRFTPKWISDTELEYTLPENVVKRYSL